jgi:hypothetical protein
LGTSPNASWMHGLESTQSRRSVELNVYILSSQTFTDFKSFQFPSPLVTAESDKLLHKCTLHSMSVRISSRKTNESEIWALLCRFAMTTCAVERGVWGKPRKSCWDLTDSTWIILEGSLCNAVKDYGSHGKHVCYVVLWWKCGWENLWICVNLWSPCWLKILVSRFCMQERLDAGYLEIPV